MTFQEWLREYVPAWYLLTLEQEESKFEEWVDWKRKKEKEEGTMTYNEIAEKYSKAGVTGYKFRNALDVKKVLGYDFRTMRGFKYLSEKDKEKAEMFICNYLNGWGIEARENIRPTSITREDLRCRFKLTIKNKGFSYLYDNGTIG